MEKIQKTLSFLMCSLLSVQESSAATLYLKKNILKTYDTQDTMLGISYDSDCYTEEGSFLKSPGNTGYSYVYKGNKQIGKLGFYTNALKVDNPYNTNYNYYFLLSCITVTPIWVGNYVGVIDYVSFNVNSVDNPNYLTIEGFQETQFVYDNLEGVFCFDENICPNNIFGYYNNDVDKSLIKEVFLFVVNPSTELLNNGIQNLAINAELENSSSYDSTLKYKFNYSNSHAQQIYQISEISLSYEIYSLCIFKVPAGQSILVNSYAFVGCRYVRWDSTNPNGGIIYHANSHYSYYPGL